MSQLNIAIFASGNGSNAEKFFEHFRNHDSIKISCLLSNNADAFALTRAENNQVPTFTFNRQEFRETETVLHYLQDKGVTHIVLAGFSKYSSRSPAKIWWERNVWGSCA